MPRRRPAIVVGGTGLYLQALLHGIPDMPDIPGGTARRVARVGGGNPRVALHARLARRDPAWRPGCSPATASGCCGPSRWSRPPAARCSPGRPTRASGRICRQRRSGSPCCRRRPPSTRGSKPGSMRCWQTVRMAEVADVAGAPAGRAAAADREGAGPARIGGRARRWACRRAGPDRYRRPDPAIRQAPAHLVPPPAPRASAAGTDRRDRRGLGRGHRLPGRSDSSARCASSAARPGTSAGLARKPIMPSGRTSTAPPSGTPARAASKPAPAPSSISTSPAQRARSRSRSVSPKTRR